LIQPGSFLAIGLHPTARVVLALQMGCGPRGDQGEQILGWANFGPVQQDYYANNKKKKLGLK
jgi:hypothetical protein